MIGDIKSSGFYPCRATDCSRRDLWPEKAEMKQFPLTLIFLVSKTRIAAVKHHGMIQELIRQGRLDKFDQPVDLQPFESTFNS